MPVYVYICESCNEEYEIIHPMVSVETFVCRKCLKPMQKAITAPKGVRIKDRALNSATGKPYDLKSTTSTYSQH